jgi:hypothetical protein
VTNSANATEETEVLLHQQQHGVTVMVVGELEANANEHGSAPVSESVTPTETVLSVAGNGTEENVNENEGVTVNVTESEEVNHVSVVNGSSSVSVNE